MIKKIIYRGSVLQYYVSGTGLPVVLIHGFGVDSSIWNEQVTLLQKKFKVLTIDLPGSGGSSMLTEENLELSAFANAVKAMITAEKIESFVLIGHSMGGYISLAYQHQFPDDLIALGLFHSTANPDSDSKKITRQKSISFIQNNGSTAFLKTCIPGLFYDQNENSVQIERLLKANQHYQRNVLIQYYEAIMRRSSSIELLTQLEIPLLIIGGKHDEITPLEETFFQSKLSNETHIYILQKSAHMGMIEEAKETNNILRVFLDYLSNSC